MVSETTTEARPQRWRALAEMHDGKTGLIYLGHSLGQIRENYAAVYEDLFAKEAKELVSKIRIERWDGMPDLGIWMFHSYVPVPRRPEVKLKFGIKR